MGRPGWGSRLLQAGVLLGLAALVWLLAGLTARHLAERGIQSGYDFLAAPAGFALAESPIAFEPSDTTLRAFGAGLGNTLKVALPAGLLALGLGIGLGFGRLSAHPLLSRAAALPVQLVRRLPLLLQLMAWYFVLTELLPAADAPLAPLPGVWLSKSGLALPWWSPAGWELPQPEGFGISGGAQLSPEYLSLLLGLACYSAAYLAETLRGAVQALPPGQAQAGLALGMRPGQVFRHILLPQAWRAALPPTTSHLLNLLKNASLGVAIGYPELVSVAGTSLNQTGRALECLSIVIGVYLLLSLAGAGLSHRLETRLARRQGTEARP
jgi:general L-amino acid transport system permease protein